MKMLNNKIDMKVLVEGVRFARKVIQKGNLVTITKAEIRPGSEVQTDEEIEAFIRETGRTVFHPVGTAAMLPREDGGVVDADLKVYGTANVRVVRVSVLYVPFILTYVSRSRI
jgi:choline dehydrogenase-like flavoprotein